MGNLRDNDGKAMTEFLYNAVNDFEYAKKDPNAIVYDSPSYIPNANLRKFIMTDSNITNNGFIDVKNMRGAYYNSNSYVARSIAKEKNLLEYIKNNKSHLINNGIIIMENDKNVPAGGEKYYSNMKVEDKKIALDGMYNVGDINNCTLYNPRIDSDGHFRAQLIDIVDYAHSDYNKQSDNISSDMKNKALYVPNEWGVKMQKSGRIKNIFNIVELDIPLSN